MQADFSEAETLYLQELKMNPQFQQVLKTLSDGLKGIPKFKPDKVLPEKGGNESQVDDWKYRSGFADGSHAVLVTLGL